MGVLLEQFNEAGSVIPRGLSIEEVSELFWESVRENEPEVFLATLALFRRTRNSSAAPGAFFGGLWHQIRERVRKYDTVYEHVDTDMMHATRATVRFKAVYGDVPGFEKGAPMHEPEALLTVTMDEGEWRVLSVWLNDLVNTTHAAA
ncbi:unnamed protein product [Pedinophyceae sp. YPF-701]|nr:unnamed protein product [Pedinophyceae sp. YPF-701]